MTVLRVCVTGAAGLISYSLVPMIASGQVFGPDQKLALTLLDINAEFALKGLNGLVLELEDCVYPLVTEVKATTDPEEAFKDVDYAILCGAFPRKQGMERKDLLEKNAGIFREQGLAIKKVGKATTKVLVVGNPANTNALLLKHYSGLGDKNVTALTRLDYNRARNMIGRRLNVPGHDVKNIIIWGNHSSTQYPDVNHATAAGKPVRGAIHDDAWLNGAFVKDVQTRGAAVIAARGASSATSAARAIVDHVRDWHLGTPAGEHVAMAVWSDGTKYGIPAGLIYSVPVVCKDGDYQIVEGLAIDDFSRELMDKTAKELSEEKEVAMEVTKA